MLVLSLVIFNSIKISKWWKERGSKFGVNPTKQSRKQSSCAISISATVKFIELIEYVNTETKGREWSISKYTRYGYDIGLRYSLDKHKG